MAKYLDLRFFRNAISLPNRPEMGKNEEWQSCKTQLSHSSCLSTVSLIISAVPSNQPGLNGLQREKRETADWQGAQNAKYRLAQSPPSLGQPSPLPSTQLWPYNSVVRAHSTGFCVRVPCWADLEQAAIHFDGRKSTERALSTTGQEFGTNT